MDWLPDYFKIVILLSIPQAYIHLRLTFAIWGMNPKQHNRKMLLFAIATPVLIDLDFLWVPIEIHLLTSFLYTLIVLYVLFRSFGHKKLLIVFFTYLILIMMTELLFALLMQLTYGLEPQEQMIQTQFLHILSLIYPIYFLLTLLSHYIEKRRFRFFHQLYQYLLNFKQARMKEMLLLVTLQFMLLGALFVILTETRHRYTETTFSVVVYTLIVLTLGALLYTIKLNMQTREEAVRQTQDVYVEEIDKMFTSIRGQRHDFLNHLQVMSSMLKMNKIEQLKRYMDDMVNEAHVVTEVVRHPCPALAAFVQAKIEMAISRSISFSYDIPRHVDIESSIKSIDLVKIMGNLVDNAFDESELLPLELRQVHLAIRIVRKKLEIEVRNQGRFLTDEDKQNMMVTGYTTKSTDHSGLGLAIVNERVQHYHGQLNIDSSEEYGTSIRVLLPYLLRAASTGDQIKAEARS